MHQIDDRRFRLAVIGCGRQAQRRLMPAALRIPGNEIVAVCDILDSRRRMAQRVAGGAARTFEDYRRLLYSVETDGVIVATPLHTHRAIAEAAFDYGHNVFCEAPMALTVDDCEAMIAAQRRADRVLQIGHPLRYHPIYDYAIHHWVKNRRMSPRIENIRCLWNRNTTWRRRIPAGLQPEPIQRWGYDDPDHLVNWRLRRDCSGGLITERLSHQMDIVNWFLDARPVAVQGVGRIDRRDGRTVFDNVHLIYEYPDGATATFEAINTNVYNCFGQQAYQMFQGETGTLVLSHRSRFVGLFFLEPGAEEELWMPCAYRIDTRFENAAHERYRKPIVVFGAASGGSFIHAIAGLPTPELINFRRAEARKTPWELEMFDFKRCCIERRRPRMDGRQGFEMAVTALKGLEAMEKRERIALTAEMFIPPRHPKTTGACPNSTGGKD